MRKVTGLAALVCVLAPILASAALADGMMVIDEATWRRNREYAYVNEPEQKAIILFDKGREDLIISVSYEGPTSNFAWVVPVPARPRVEILKGAAFHELAALVAPKPRAADKSEYGAMSAPLRGVVVLERKTVGAYDVSVLSATDGQALMKWLKANKYHLPDTAIKPIKSYVARKWTFVASRIKVPASAKGLQTGTLAPLRLTFRTPQPVYPMKLSSANPKPFSLLLYMLLPSGQATDRPWSRDVIPVRGRPRTGMVWCASLPAGQTAYPTLAKLSHSALQVYIQKDMAVKPEDCTIDYTWERPVQ